MGIIFKALLSALWGELFKPLIRLLLSLLGKVFLKEAKWAVEYVVSHPGLIEDEDKRRVALEILQSRLKSDGKDISDSLGNFFIELVLQMKKKRWE